MNLTVTNILKRVLPLKGFCYRWARWVEGVGAEGRGVIEVGLAARQGAKACCGRCGRAAPGYDRPEKVRCWQFISLWTIRIFFVYARRRVQCGRCGVRVERLPWASGKLQVCDALRIFLAQWARLLSWQEVAARFQVQWNDVYGAVKGVVRYGLRHRDRSGIEALGVDEVCVAKGKLWTVVYQIDQGARRLLWIGQDRKAATLEMIFNRLGRARCAAVQFICSDMWRGYLGVIARRMPQALHILDRFHIRKNLGEAIDQIRRAESHAMARAGLAPLLKKLRWTLLKHRRNWTSKESRRMRELLGCGLRSLRAFLLVESFEHFWTYNSPTWADKFLKGWSQRVARSRLAPLQRVAKSLVKHRALLLNYFIARKQYSSGVVEGLNNKAKVTMRKSYGFRTFRCLELALYHSLGKLPEPESPHDFF
jgi:transposase